jgi:SAM-dependent methyltransferase
MASGYAHMLSNAASIIVAVGGAIVITRQVRKPAWFIGRLVVRGMNFSHAELRSWGLNLASIAGNATILDVGCGGGGTIAALAAAGAGRKVYGVDFSDASVAVARATNARLIEEGRVSVQQGNVSALPFEPDTFDVVTAFETHFYWPDLPANVKEIQRVLKPGGQVAIVAEVYRGRTMDWLYRPAMALLKTTYLTLEEHKGLLVNAGYVDVDVIAERSKGWMCAIGRKPSN